MGTVIRGGPLTWVQPRMLKREYVLRAGRKEAATLRFRSAFGSLATGQSPDGCWTFKRLGFLKTQVTIRVCGEDANIAVFRNNTWRNGGTLELSDGRQLRVTTNLWQSRLDFTSDAGNLVLRFKRRGTLRSSAEVEVGRDAWGMAELPQIVMLGWYLMVMMQEDAAAVIIASG